MKIHLFILVSVFGLLKGYGQGHYIYDPLNRVVQIDNGNCSGIKYTYDPNGNRKSEYPYSISTKDSVLDETCPHANDGSLILIGSGDFSYKWSSGQTTSTIKNLPPGNYSVIIKDNPTGATCSKSFTILSQFVDSFAMQTHDDFCAANNTASAKVSVIIPDIRASYTYHWSNSNDTVFTSIDSIGNIPGGKYSVAIRNTYTGCIKVLNFVIAGSIDIKDSVKNESCPHANDGQIILSSPDSSSYTYLWSNGQTGAHISNLVPGNYSVVIQSAIDSSQSCKRSYTILPQFVDSFTVQAHNISCYGYSNGYANAIPIIKDARSNYSYRWSSLSDTAYLSSDSVSNLNEGNYSVKIRNSYTGCIIALPFAITQPTPSISSIQKTDNACFGADKGSATVLMNGTASQYTYKWTSTQLLQAQSTQKIDSLASGTYYITTIQDFGNKCNMSDTVTISGPTQSDLIGIDIDSVSALNTTDGTATAQVLGDSSNYMYQWYSVATNTYLNQRSAAVTGLSAGDYVLTIISLTSDSCKSSEAFTISAKNPGIQYTLLPNPTNGFVYVTVYTEGVNDIVYTVINSGGQVLFSSSVTVSNGQTIPINLSSYSDGPYFIRLVANNQKTTLKVIKQ